MAGHKAAGGQQGSDRLEGDGQIIKLLRYVGTMVRMLATLFSMLVTMVGMLFELNLSALKLCIQL